jgi:NAD(P)-dependent dehydrogenase (short-subunit alcohol dehydrogenase family)
LKGKKIVVTGATSGIGLSLCLELSRLGAVVLAIGRNTSSLEKLQEDESNIVPVQYDLCILDGIETMIEAFVDVHGKIDGFVHCAGVEETIPLMMYTPNKILNIFTVNVFSGIELLRIISKKKMTNDSASIVFISSVMGELGQSGKVGYCSSKAAIAGVVKSSALELAKRAIRINSILPGIVKTSLSQKLFSSLPMESVQQIEKMHPLGFGETSDVVPILIFLLSDKSRWITGQSVVIDGGYSIQ